MLNFSSLSAICKCSTPSANSQITQSFILESLFLQSDHVHFRFFLMSHKILQFYVVWLTHSFSCLHDDTLSGNNYFHAFTSHVFFFLSQIKQTPFFLHFSCFQTLNVSSIFFYPLLLALLILWRGTHNCLHKTSYKLRSI